MPPLLRERGQRAERTADFSEDTDGGMLAAFLHRQAEMLGKAKVRLHSSTRHSKTERPSFGGRVTAAAPSASTARPPWTTRVGVSSANLPELTQGASRRPRPRRQLRLPCPHTRVTRSVGRRPLRQPPCWPRTTPLRPRHGRHCKGHGQRNGRGSPTSVGGCGSRTADSEIHPLLPGCGPAP